MSCINSSHLEVDILVIGAGMSGINTAYHIQKDFPNGITYAILEARGSIGGTWDVFRYPGIRTDSDINTYAFPWNPIDNPKQVLSGGDLLNYMQSSAALHKINEKIYFNHRVVSMDWQSKTFRWCINVCVDGTTSKAYNARFVVLGTGYYDHDTALTTNIPGIKSFTGPVVHPQFWPKDLDYSQKTVAIIGSGATAITLLPAMADAAKHVTMVQRSPTYFLSSPAVDSVGNFLRKLLSSKMAHKINRWRWSAMVTAQFYYTVLFPYTARAALIKDVVKQLPQSIPWNPHFNPRYNPWKQRLGVCPDGDFFATLRSGKASVITDTIKAVTDTEIHFDSGEVSKPDIIVTATGLKMRPDGGIRLSVDGVPVDLSAKFYWRDALIQDVPNLLFVKAYYNASHTLAAEVAAQLLIRLFRVMSKKGAHTVVPRMESSEGMIEEVPFVTSTYVKAGLSQFPKSGKGVWARRENYFTDMFAVRWGDINTGLEYIK